MAQGFRTPAAANLRCCIASRAVVPRLDCAAACSCERTQFSEIGSNAWLSSDKMGVRERRSNVEN